MRDGEASFSCKSRVKGAAAYMILLAGWKEEEQKEIILAVARTRRAAAIIAECVYEYVVAAESEFLPTPTLRPPTATTTDLLLIHQAFFFVAFSHDNWTPTRSTSRGEASI